MRITKIKTTTTLYDTNGKQISVVKKEETTAEAPILLNKEDAKAMRQTVEIYKLALENAKSMKASLEEAQGFKKGRKTFSEIADLIMTVYSPLKDKQVTEKTTSLNQSKEKFKAETDSVLKASEIDYSTDVKIGKSTKIKRSLH